MMLQKIKLEKLGGISFTWDKKYLNLRMTGRMQRISIKLQGSANNFRKSMMILLTGCS